MSALASNGESARSGSATTSQVHDTNADQEHECEPGTLESYARTLSTVGREAGERRSREADPDGLARVLEAIEDLANEGWTFTAADVRARTGPGFGAIMGAAFHTARRQGLIEAVGVEASKSVTRHSSLVRTWRRS